MKKDWTRERERQLQMMSEEKEIIVSERAKLEVAMRLNTGSNESAKVEVSKNSFKFRLFSIDHCFYQQ